MSNSTTSWQGVIVLPFYCATDFQKIAFKSKKLELKLELEVEKLG